MAAEAEPETQPQQQQQQQTEPSREENKAEAKEPPRLTRLDFARVAAARAVVCLVGLYGLAKSRAGPLRPAVDAAESAVARAVGPVHDRFHETPLALLAFLDRKVDDIVQLLDRKLPPTLKAALSQAYTVARDVPEVARELLTEAHKSGVAGAGRAAYVKVEPVAKDLYLHYGAAAGQLAVSIWRSLNKLPLFPQVAQIAVPTAAHWAERYNKAIGSAASRGYSGARYLPPIPTKLIGKLFSEGGAAVEETQCGVKKIARHPLIGISESLVK